MQSDDIPSPWAIGRAGTDRAATGRAMSFPDVLLLIIRWVHALAAVSWVGGGMFYLLVLRPNIRSLEADQGLALRRLGQQFRAMVNTAIAVLIVTGVIMTFARLTSEFVGTAYVVVLVVKVALALYMFYLVRFLRPRTYSDEPGTYSDGEKAPARGFRRATNLMTGATAVLVIGVIVFLLADILKMLIEKGIEG